MNGILRKKFLKKLSDAVVEMDEEAAVRLAWKIVLSGMNAWKGIDKGLVYGMERAGNLLSKRNILFLNC